MKNRAQSQQPLGPVFFMHGLFATAADYLMTGANTALRKKIFNLKSFEVHLFVFIDQSLHFFYKHFFSQIMDTIVGWEILEETITA